MSVEHGELSARVLSYLKRKSGNGLKPTDAETNAAGAALKLISTAFPAYANDPAAMFKKLIELSRKGSSSKSDIIELSQTNALKLQQVMDKQSQMLQMMSNIAKAQSDTTRTIISNLR